MGQRSGSGWVGGHGKLVGLSVVVHLSVLVAIFDVYYSSPLVLGLEPAPLSPLAGPPPAARLILIVADGLRAQSFYSLDAQGKPRAPFLFGQASRRGSWGLSHTRVPTESRPGHVAIIAGFYEDVSAVARGWKENPVAFDSLFNQSTHTWSWGSPDILPMFSKGATPGKVDDRMYSPELEDFASATPSNLDTWVFDEFAMQLKAAGENAALKEKMSAEGVVFFLHLLGIDTSGHGYKPHSPQYLDGIRVVDDGVRRLSADVAAFFGDERTAFVFTADHGMTDWGSHGAGHETETVTPVVAWGPGVRGPKAALAADSAFHVGQLKGLERRDLEQVDLAPFMAALIGKPVPVNSIGQLPQHLLSVNERYRYGVLDANWRQMMGQYKGKRQERWNQALKMFFSDFPPLSQKKLNYITDEMAKLVEQKRWKIAGDLCSEWISVVRDGFFYFHNYDRGILSALVASIFLAFVALTTYITNTPNKLETLQLRLRNLDRFEQGALALLAAVAWLQSLNIMTIYYCLVLLYLLGLVRRVVVVDWDSVDAQNWRERVWECGVHVSLCVIGSGCLVGAFFYRGLLSAVLIGLGLWGYRGGGRLPGSRDAFGRRVRECWAVLCVLLAAFPLLPTIGRHTSLFTALVGPALLVTAAFIFEGRSGRPLWPPTLRVVQYGSVGLSCVASVAVGVGFGPARLLSWLLLFTAPVFTLMGPPTLGRRLESLYVGLLTPFVLMCLSHESIFFILLCALLVNWLGLEANIEGVSLDNILKMQFHTASQVSVSTGGWAMWRRAYMFLFFLLLSFFGTGNIASLNSFDPSFTRCFTTVFDPFLMSALLMGKVVTPLVAVCVGVVGLERILAVPPSALLLPTLIFSDLMAIGFFFLLKDSGSWLEIGTSISHYVISLATTLFALLLSRLAAVLTSLHLVIPRNFGIITE